MFKTTKAWAEELGIKDYNEKSLRKVNVARTITSEIAGYGTRMVTRNIIANTPVRVDKLPPVTKFAYGVAAVIMPVAVGNCVEGFIDGLFGDGVLIFDAVKRAREEGGYESEDGCVLFKITKIEEDDEDDAEDE